MERTAILLPVLALVALTLLVLVALGIFRVIGFTTGRFNREYYRFFRQEDDQEPDVVRAIARNYHNLLELPILFYTGALLAYAADVASETLVVLAWAFVALRVVHTVIHVAYHRVVYRMLAFITGALVLIAFWIVLGRALLA